MTTQPAPRPRQNVVWFDIPVTDLDRALRFYRAVLKAEIAKQEFPGGAIAVLPHGDSVIGGCLVVGDGKPAAEGPLLYFDANGRLDAAVAAATANGGAVLKAKHEIP